MLVTNLAFVDYLWPAPANLVHSVANVIRL